MRKIRVYPDNILQSKSKAVGKITGKVTGIIDDLVQNIKEGSVEYPPIALSAVQLGEPLRIMAFMMNPDYEDSDIVALINPDIIYRKKLRWVTESCCSLPGRVFSLRRYQLCKVRGMLPDGREKTFRGHGTLAQVFQHEIDHHAGILLNQIAREVKKR